MRVWVEIVEAGQPPREQLLSAGTTIGRDPSNDCRIEDETVSKSHARIVDLDGRLAVVDAGSTHGTWIDGGERLSPAVPMPLIPALELRLGRSLLRVLDRPSLDDELSDTCEPDFLLDEPSTVPAADPATEPPAGVSSDAPTVLPEPASRASAEPRPVPSLTPAPSASNGGELEDQEVEFTEGANTLDAESDGMAQAIASAELARRKPRLVFTSGKVGQAVDITEPVVTIGRQGAGAGFINPGDVHVSKQHAMLRCNPRLEQQLFLVEDLDSKHGTWVADEKLTPGIQKELGHDILLRIGFVDAFVAMRPRTGEEVRFTGAYERTLGLLREADVLSSKDHSAAMVALRSGEHPGQYLVCANKITVRQWCEEYRRADLGGAPRTKGAAAPWIVIAVAVIIGAAVALAWSSLR